MEESQIFNEKPNDNTITNIIQKYLPFWPILILAISISVGFSYLYLRAQVPIYVASAKVLLKDPQKGTGDTKVLDALNIFSEKKIVENEIIVLRSSTIMKEVVKSLDLYAKVYKDGNVYLEELYGKNLPFKIKALHKENIEGCDKINVGIDWAHRVLTINDKQNSFDSAFKLGNDLYSLDLNDTYKPKNGIDNYVVDINSVGEEASAIIGSLTAAPISYSSTVIDVKIESPVPEKAADILNKLFEVYNKFGIEDKNQMAIKTLDFIEDRLKSVTNQLDSVERNIEEYKSKYDVINLSDQATVYLNSFKELDKENSILDIQMQLLDDLSRYVNSKQNKDGTVPSLFLLNDETLKSLLGQLYTAEFELDKAKKSAGDKSDLVLLAEQKVNRIKSDIKENIINVKRNFNIQKVNNEKAIASNKLSYASVPNKERGLLGISREQEIKNNIYSYLLQKREETAMSSASTSADLRLLESGYSFVPIRPVSKNYYWFGLIAGIILFLFYVQFREKIKNKVMFRSDIEKKTTIPVISEILQSKTKDVIAIYDGKRSVIAEQFRTLRTNLNFVGLNENNNTLLITSSISGEGKSFVAINLAISITLTGKKVALLEMDLRKPKLSNYLNIEVAPGISNYLVGKANLDQIIKPTKFENLFLVTAGTIPPNPTELIVKAEFEELMKSLKSNFDYVIIDTAPIGPVTDAQIIAKYADVSIFMVRHDYTPIHFIKLIDGLNNTKKFKNMSIVFNGINPRGTSFLNYSFGGYGNGYGEGYGYGYGYSKSYSSYYIKDKSQPGYNDMWNVKERLINLFKKK